MICIKWLAAALVAARWCCDTTGRPLGDLSISETGSAIEHCGYSKTPPQGRRLTVGIDADPCDIVRLHKHLGHALQ